MKTLNYITQSLLTHFNLIKIPQKKSDFAKLCGLLGDNGTLSVAQASKILRLLNMEKTRVEDVMVPRSNMSMIKINDPIEQIEKRIKESGHSRFPVMDDDNDKVIGILHAKDLVTSQAKTCKKSLLRSVFFVPESKRLDSLLREFQHKHVHMAIVIDEYGDIAGLITIEDIIEQITGDIEDEHDPQSQEKNIEQLATNKFRIRAETSIEDFNQYFDAKLSSEEMDTIGGIILDVLSYIPKKNEQIIIDDFVFIVENAGEKQIYQLLMSHRKQHRHAKKNIKEQP